MGDGGSDRLSFLGRRLPPGFEGRTVLVIPGGARAYDRAEWAGALVIVERGEVELECEDGTRHRFRCGDVLWLDDLPLRAMHNRTRRTALLVAISRTRRSAESGRNR